MGDYYSNWRIGMIGLAFLVIGLLWLALSVFLAVKLPKWFGASKPEWRWLLGGVIFLVLLIGPFVDHIVDRFADLSGCSECEAGDGEIYQRQQPRGICYIDQSTEVRDYRFRYSTSYCEIQPL